MAAKQKASERGGEAGGGKGRRGKGGGKGGGGGERAGKWYDHGSRDASPSSLLLMNGGPLCLLRD